MRCTETLDTLWEGYGTILHPNWDRRVYLASPATLLDVVQGPVEFVDTRNNKRNGNVSLKPVQVVIAGAPNAGKSTLLNRLAGHDAAIVSEQPGTTRDVLREHIQIEGVPVLLLDTAGLRHSTDAIESEGMRRAREQLGTDDIVQIVRHYQSRTFGFASRNYYCSFLAALRLDRQFQSRQHGRKHQGRGTCAALARPMCCGRRCDD